MSPIGSMQDTLDLAERTKRYAALDLVSQPVWVFDIDRRRVHWANTEALQVWIAPTLAELCGRDMGQDMSDSVARRLQQYQSDFVSHGATFKEQWTLYPAGIPVSLSVRFSGHRLHDGRMAMLCEASPADNREPESLRSVEALLHTAVMTSLYGSDGQVLYRNPAARAAAITPDERLEDRIADPLAYAAICAALDRDGVATHTLSVKTPQGERWHELSARRCRDAVTGQNAVLVSEADISAVKRTQERAHFLALHDELTGLPNRSHALQHFDRTVATLPGTALSVALLFIDLDHFKDVNDTLGHAAGDELLVQMARRLCAVVQGTDFVARLGGDEFLILLVSDDIRAAVERMRLCLLATVGQPLQLHGTDVRVTPSAGVALYPHDGTDVETLLRNADLAMYSAKARGRNDLAYYDRSMSDAVHYRTELEAELRQALARDEFEVYYQPRVAVGSGRIVGAEALVRWQHPTRGLLGPDVFITMCETTGLIRQLGNLVLLRAARQQAQWTAQGHDFVISVNLSARQLAHPELLTDIGRALAESGADPTRLELEITESMLLGDDPNLRDLLHAIRAMGISIGLDDFGTGYSNLGYLQRFPIETLKIDKSFIQVAVDDLPLTETIVSMCRLMNFNPVAEGVETAAQLQWVSDQGIAQFQGFLFSKPLPLDDFDTLLRESELQGL